MCTQTQACSWAEICPGLNGNEIQISYDKHHKVSSLVKSHQNTHNSVKYEVLIKQYLCSILDISVVVKVLLLPVKCFPNQIKFKLQSVPDM